MIIWDNNNPTPFKDMINQVICGDCLDVMKHIPDKSVDLVLTDPPYNAGMVYANDNLKIEDHCAFVNNYLNKLYMILKENSNIVIIIGIKYQHIFWKTLSKYFIYNWQFVLYKNNGMLNGKATFAKWDSILWFSKGDAIKWNRQRKGIFSFDVWECPIRPIKNKFGHPTPKDIKSISGIVQLFSNKEDIILDPFLGSGTTAVACKELGRNFIGIEKEKKYCEIAERRLAQEYLF